MIFIIIPKGSIERKPYFFTNRCLYPNIDNASLYLFGNIFDNRTVPIRDQISDAAQRSLYVYAEDLFAQTSDEMAPYVDLVDTSSLTGNNFMKMIKTIKCAQEICISKQLEANLRPIIQNALISYVESIEINAALPCNRERITAFVVSYIENIVADGSKPLNSYIEDFNYEITNRFMAEIISSKLT